MGRRTRAENLGDFHDSTTSSHGDLHTHVTADGARLLTQTRYNAPQKRHHGVPVTEQDERLAEWTPVSVAGMGDMLALADTITSYDVSPDAEDGNEGEKAKRRRYASSNSCQDDPMSTWLPYSQFYLDELIRREGLGEFLHSPKCSFCGDRYGTDNCRIFRCQQCGCFLQCGKCVMEQHIRCPLHTLREWNGEYWDDISLQAPVEQGGLGLVFQLGHHGFACENPGQIKSLVVMDVRGIFSLRVRLCSCEYGQRRSDPVQQLLAHGCSFDCSMLLATSTPHDFVGTLERLTDAANVGKLPDRYKTFIRMARQHTFLTTAKRLGRAHEKNGLVEEKHGGFALRCWACPDVARNLPEGWRNVRKKDAYLYKLILAVDANFRLKNRIRANAHNDPSLIAGRGYFVESDAYKAHLKAYVNEKDISTCVAFAALLQKDTRISSGLRVSGVGGCVCARHGLLRPGGIGDLQKGERYANMDFIVLSALQGEGVESLAISYDIGCQWSVHLPERATRLKDSGVMDNDLSGFKMQFALPVWHAAAHEIACRTANSLSYRVGVGKTDGEGIERTWSTLNPIGWSTKEMGEGARQDAIEDRLDHINFEKNRGQGNTLARKLVVALAESARQDEEFDELDAGVDATTRAIWNGKIRAWLADPSQPSPYLLDGDKDGAQTQKSIMEELKMAELEEVRAGNAPLVEGKMTSAAFIEAGLQLEAQQRRIIAETKNTTLLNADRSSQIQERRFTFFRKHKTFLRLQLTYMPGVEDIRMADEAARDPDAAPPKAEFVKLYLPSQLPADRRSSACGRGVLEAEVKLRVGQCGDALRELRAALNTQTHLIYWRNENSVGQRSATRSASLISRVGETIAKAAAKYRDSQAALVAIKGSTFAPQFRPLLDIDINARPGVENDIEAMKRLAGADSSRVGRNVPSQVTLNRTVSWIWTTGGSSASDLHDSVRVDWSKAKARRERWREEVKLVREEMKRVLRSLRWEQDQWRGRMDNRNEEPGISAELKSGLRAYALRQADLHRRIGERFFLEWSKSIEAALGGLMRNLLDGGEEELAVEEHDERTMRRGIDCCVLLQMPSLLSTCGTDRHNAKCNARPR
ncbi:CxC2 domain-containing protein [Mycena indigotica]|uniref:CxC2 domain-containing protein n=1 Tax=Mycena indigotica TaxID=2126181 RepID=A0A8H6VUE9_9AGAR|nr:CxC2 domain-containing protein [Mycena indigotica]KAF7288624.1 CxC2 domain-containing protein [Mycena indigotica]